MTTMPASPLERLASLFEYPVDDLSPRVQACARDLAGCPPALEALQRFAAAIGDMTPGQLQEEYTATFDFAESCALEVGWHIYGDTHERGAFMSGLRADLERAGIAETSGLPDHLTHVLALVARDGDGSSGLLEIAAPALERVRRALEDRRSPYVHAATAVRELLAVKAPAVFRKEPSQ